MELKNKVTIITGAARGIGKAIAIEFAKEGAKVVVSDVDIDNCEIVCDNIKDLGYDALAIECDVSNKKEVFNLVKKTINKYQKIDVLVNCASEDNVDSFLEMSEKDWDSSININLKGVFLVTQVVAKKMVEQKNGKIIFISSVIGEVGMPYTTSYSVAKAGVINLTKGLSIELAEHKINVNSIVSGVLPTQITQNIIENKISKKEFLKNIPLKRLGKPQDIADAAVFLASDKSSYITGHNLVVDGGWLSQ
jgi:3-oxoacyl-[acyl-carrier protein] reductase